MKPIEPLEIAGTLVFGFRLGPHAEFGFLGARLGGLQILQNAIVFSAEIFVDCGVAGTDHFEGDVAPKRPEPREFSTTDPDCCYGASVLIDAMKLDANFAALDVLGEPFFGFHGVRLGLGPEMSHLQSNKDYRFCGHCI